MKRIISFGLAVLLVLAIVPVASFALSQYGTVTGGWLRLRSGPSFDASTISSYYTGTQVLITGTSGNWYAVEAPDGKTGYMYASYITFSGGSGGSAYVTSSNGLGVRLRSGPGTGYSVLGIFSVGTAVTVLETGTYWSKIQIGSTVGYMMNKFITTSGGGGSGYSATVWSDNGYGVRLRSGPGTGYSIIGVYSVGTLVTVLSHGATWDYISVGSRTGYMMNYYLRSSGQGLATGISVSTTADYAMPGSVVTVSTSVTGNNLSSPAYTLAVTQNASMASLNGDSLTISSAATNGSVIQITATTVDNSGAGSKLTAVCYVTVGNGSVGVATSISLVPSTYSAPVGASVTLNASVTGQNLSSPPYTLDVIQNANMVSLSGTTLTLLSTATVGSVIRVQATSKENSSAGTKLTAVCDITVSAASGVVTSFKFNTTAATATVSTTGGSLEITPEVLGTNLTQPLFTLAVSSNASSYVTATRDASTGKVLISILGTIPDSTMFTVTGTTLDKAANGTHLTATVTVTVSRTGTVQSISVAPVTATIDSGAQTTFNVRITYTNGSYVDNPTASENYDLAVTSGAASCTWDGATNTLTGVGGDTDATVTVQATAKANTGITASCQVTVLKLSKPSAPTLITVKAETTRALLTWAAPTSTSGLAITYKFYYNNSTDPNTASLVTPTSQTATTATIEGLMNGTTYTFWVVAVNSKGDSAFSNGITVTPNKSVPDAPTGLTVVGVGYQWIMLSWTRPDYDGVKDITQYKVYYNGQNTTTTATSITLSSLTNSTQYSIYVTASNGEITGESAASNIVVATPSAIGAATVKMTEPAVGDSPQTAAEVEAATANANFTVTSVTWNPTDDPFVATTYTATVVLTAKAAIAFQPTTFTPTVTTADTVSTVIISGDAQYNTATFTVQFPVAKSSKGVVSLESVESNVSGDTYVTATATPTAEPVLTVQSDAETGTTVTQEPVITPTATPTAEPTAEPVSETQPEAVAEEASTPQIGQFALDTVSCQFPNATAGYASVAAHTTIVFSTGSTATGDLTLSLGGTNPGAFGLSTTYLSGIPAGSSATFTVAPRTGLSMGVYNATVTVSDSSGAMASFPVSFTVLAGA